MSSVLTIVGHLSVALLLVIWTVVPSGHHVLVMSQSHHPPPSQQQQQPVNNNHVSQQKPHHHRAKRQQPEQSDWEAVSAALTGDDDGRRGGRGLTPVTLANFSALGMSADIGHVLRNILEQLNVTARRVRQGSSGPPLSVQFNAGNRPISGARLTRVTRLNLNPLLNTIPTTTITTTTPRPNTNRGLETRATFHPRAPSASSSSSSSSIGDTSQSRAITTQPRPASTEAQSLRRSSREGKIRLVGGQTLFEGNVEINHMGQWGSVCDDEWDLTEANVACRQLGFVLGAVRATGNSRYGKSRKLIWMDDMFCSGSEGSLQDCSFAGWNVHDCSANEAAGVVCRTRADQQAENVPVRPNSPKPTVASTTTAKPVDNSSENIRLMSLFGDDIPLRLIGDRVDHEGRIELRVNNQWQVMCGDGFSVNEAQVVCRQLGFGFADRALHLRLPDHEQFSPIFSGIACTGAESRISRCTMADNNSGKFCPDSYDNIAGVACVADLPDLIPVTDLLEQSAFLEDRSILFLQCAMEENCLSKSAYEIDKEDPNWIYETRRLLRFTAAIRNIGRVDFRPFAAKHEWVWHSCHRHYHSMEVFAHFDVLDLAGNRVAEGHKASFCLEDNVCQEGSRGKFMCANYGDQGISVGCVDIYKSDLDCQWIDITDITPGEYQLKITINPEFKVPEMTYDNNAALCHFYYTPIGGHVTNCSLVRP